MVLCVLACGEMLLEWLVLFVLFGDLVLLYVVVLCGADFGAVVVLDWLKVQLFGG